MALAVVSCGDNPPPNYPLAVTFDQNELPLGPGDKIVLTAYYGSKSIQASYVLDASGAISVQYIGTVEAKNKTTIQLQEEIRQRLADGYLQNPIVSVNLIELNSLTLSVSGMVGKSGNIKYQPGLMITEVIAQSGGFTPLARKNLVKVVRKIDGTPHTYKVPVEKIQEGERPNMPMMPGDEVFVPERPW